MLSRALRSVNVGLEWRVAFGEGGGCERPQSAIVQSVKKARAGDSLGLSYTLPDVF
jgi:hypothetical protein